MDKNFDFGKIGRRMPYTVPGGAFDELERNVMQRLEADGAIARRGRRSRLRIAVRAALAAAAAVAVLMVMNVALRPAPAYDMAAVEQAFANLSDNDQAYIMEIYEDDLFFNEQY